MTKSKILLLSFQTCTSIDHEGSGGENSIKPKDKTNFLMLMMCHTCLVCIVFVIGLKSKFKRREAENMRIRETRNSFIAQNMLE